MTMITIAPSPLAGEGWGEGFAKAGSMLAAANIPDCKLALRARLLSQPSPARGEG
jgi:hypothetical protein